MDPSDGKNLFREARLAARHCIFPEQAKLVRDRTDECKAVFDRFNISASKRDFEELVAAWTRLLLALAALGPMATPPGSQGGALPVPQARAA